jgi:MscS family membrane protein
MENIVGGLLLKFQDKFHVGDRISVPAIKRDNLYVSNGDGVVEEIHYITTKLRCLDDSIMIIPNAMFIQGQVVNWSRTPYRLFSTAITVKESDTLKLPTLIKELRTSLEKDDGIEHEKRDLIVTATGFESGSTGNVKVEIRVSLKGNNEPEVSEIKTRIVNVIAKTMDQVLKSPSYMKASTTTKK